MRGKVALEEHFAITETLEDSAGFFPGEYWTELKSRLLDMQDRRLREMDAHGIEIVLARARPPAPRIVRSRAVSSILFVSSVRTVSIFRSKVETARSTLRSKVETASCRSALVATVSSRASRSASA